MTFSKSFCLLRKHAVLIRERINIAECMKNMNSKATITITPPASDKNNSSDTDVKLKIK